MAEYPHITRARILAVDDVAEWREIIRTAFTPFEADLQEAANGEEALKTMIRATTSGRPFDLVLLDFSMPAMNGGRLLAHIRSTPMLRDTPVIITTIESDRDHVQLCRDYGVSAYILKPYKCDRLLQEANRAIGASRED